MKKILILLIALLALLISCDSEPVSSETQTIDQSSVFKSTQIDIPDNFTHGYDNPNGNYGYRASVIFVENKAYLLGGNRLDDGNTESVFLIYDFDSRTSTIEKINTYNEDAYVDHIAFDSQMNQITIESASGVKTLNKMSASGDKMFSFEIARDTQKVITDESDNIYVAFGDILENYDPNGNHLNSIGLISFGYNDFNLLSNGKIYVEFVDNGNRLSYKYVNEDGKSLSNLLNKNANKTMVTGDGYDMYYFDNISLYGYDESDNTLYTLINWMDSGIAGSGIVHVYVNSADRIVYRHNDPITKEFSLCVAEKTDEIVKSETKDIVIGYMRNSYMLDTVVQNFNAIHSEYNVILKSYYDVDPVNYRIDPTRLNLDILSGNAPDIIIPARSMPLMSYINKGMFVDMYEFIDNDPDLSRDSFYNIIYSTYERDGKLYQFAADTNIYAWVTKEKNVNAKDTWTYNEFLELYNSIPDGVTFSDYLNQLELSYILFDTGLSDFVDYKKGTCDFKNEVFYDILNAIKLMPYESYIWTDLTEDERNNYYLYEHGLYRNDEIMVDQQSIISVWEFMIMTHKFGFEDITFMGFPSPYGDRNAAFLSSTEFMITEQSQVKDEAWEFIKYFISDDIQMARMDKTLSTKKDVLKQQFEHANTFHLYLDQIGTPYIEGYELTEDQINSMGLTEFEFTDEHFAIMENLMNSTNRQYSYDEQLCNIVYEEITAFIGSTKTAEETANIIQNRASVYLSEIK